MLRTVSDTVPFTLLGQPGPDRARPVGPSGPGQPTPAWPGCVYTTNVAVLDRAEQRQTPSVNGVLVMNVTLKKFAKKRKKGKGCMGSPRGMREKMF